MKIRRKTVTFPNRATQTVNVYLIEQNKPESGEIILNHHSASAVSNF